MRFSLNHLRLIAVVLLVGASPSLAQSVSSGEMFDPAIAVKEIVYTRDACGILEQQHTAIWAEVEGKGYCLRYYAAGLKSGHNDIAALWLHGDIMGAHESPPTKRLSGLGVDAMIEQEKRLSVRHDVPFIFMGRPGSYGSAGRHYTMRERRIEADIVEAAIDGIKKRYGIEKWALGGHSGGGILVSEMLNHRKDLTCAVMSSASGAFRAYLATYNSPDTNNPIVLDPIASLTSIPKDAKRRIFDVYDPRDSNVKLSVHQEYDKALKAQQVEVELVSLEKALGPEYHDMVDFGETALGMCASGAGSATIFNTLKQMPDQQKRKTN